MEDIILVSNVYTVEKIKKKTKAKMFENLKVGEQIQFSVPLRRVGRNNRGTYATYITAKNIDTGEVTEGSFNQLPKIIDSFELS